MSRAVPRTPPWVAAYRSDRDELLLARVRLGSLVILPPVLGITVCNAVADPGNALLRGSLAIPFLVLSVVGLVACRVRPFEGWGLWAAVVFMMLLTAGSGLTWHSLPQDADMVPLYLCVLLMASTLIFPWGARPQMVVSVFMLVVYVWAVGGIVTRAHASVVVVIGAMIPVNVVGAMVFEASRRATFERAWQKEQLVSLARDLALHTEGADVIRTVLAHGVPLIGADWAWVVLYDPARRVYRFADIAGEHGDTSWLGVEIPEEFPSIPLVLARGLVVFPADAPDEPVVRMMREHGSAHALYVTLRHGGDRLGVLGLGRVTDLTFGPAERVLAQGIADQASLALRTAQVIADLRRASQLKSEFVSTMSHELRTPLNVILGYAEMARDGLPVAECLGRIEGAGRELLDLIESTLEIGKLEAQRDESRVEPVALPAFWQELRKACALLPRAPGVRLELEEPLPDSIVHTDPRKLAIVLRNLIGNACKFTERGSIRVTSTWADGRLELRVADTGIGIRPEDHEAIFEMFRQGDGSDSRRYGGTGLGLYIVRRFTEQLGATIALESAPGRGSTFTVSLPGGPAPHAAAA